MKNSLDAPALLHNSVIRTAKEVTDRQMGGENVSIGFQTVSASPVQCIVHIVLRRIKSPHPILIPVVIQPPIVLCLNSRIQARRIL